MQMMFNIEEFLEVAIESWSEWDLNPQSLNSVLTLRLSYHDIIYIIVLLFY